MLFLVKGLISKSAYMGRSENFDAINLVDAEDEDAARDLFTKFYEQKGDPYGDSYSVYNCHVIPTINQASIRPETN